MSGFPGGADAEVHSLACGTWAGCSLSPDSGSWSRGNHPLPVTAFCLLWVLVCVRRGEVLEGGEEIKDYADQLPSSKEMHGFSQHQVVVKCYSHS